MGPTGHTPRRPNGKVDRDARRLEAELKDRLLIAATALQDLTDGSRDYRRRYGMDPAVAVSIDHQSTAARAALTTLASTLACLDADRLELAAAMDRHPSAAATNGQDDDQ